MPEQQAIVQACIIILNYFFNSQACIMYMHED